MQRYTIHYRYDSKVETALVDATMIMMMMLMMMMMMMMMIVMK